MNLIPKLKIIPLVAIIALGLSMSPTLSLAGDKEHGKDNGRRLNQQSHESGKPVIRHPRKEVTVAHGYDGHTSNYRAKNYRKGTIVKPGRHVYYRDSIHRHDHHGHGRPKYVIVDHDCHDCHDHYVDYDDVRFSIGVHTGNFDIVFRD